MGIRQVSSQLPSNFGVIMFIYQTFGWHWIDNQSRINTNMLLKGRDLIDYMHGGDLAPPGVEME
jgi:hypothetical protein